VVFFSLVVQWRVAVVDSIAAGTKLRNNLGQVVYTSLQQITGELNGLE